MQLRRLIVCIATSSLLCLTLQGHCAASSSQEAGNPKKAGTSQKTGNARTGAKPQSGKAPASHLGKMPPAISAESSNRVNATDEFSLESLRGKIVLLLFTSTG